MDCVALKPQALRQHLVPADVFVETGEHFAQLGRAKVALLL
jgi:hypothetical protein